MQDGEIEGVVGELASLVGIPFAQVWQPARDRVVLGLADGTLILMVPRGPDARLHTITERPRNPAKPFSFQGACRARLRGALTRVEKLPGERVVRVWFGAAHLELRLAGRSGGLWLVDADTVVAAHDGPAPATLPDLPRRGPVPDTAARFEPVPTWNEAVRGFYEGRERQRLREEQRARVEVRLRRAVQRAERLVENLEQDLRKADEAPAIRHRADLLAANLHRATRGLSELWVDDWEGGAPVRIQLDPAKPATATLDRLYHQARRLDRVGERVLERLEGVERELREHRDALAHIDELPDDVLERLDRTLPRGEGRPRRADAPTLPYVTWVGPHGERVLVGRNAAGNRRLVFQVAKGHDWWMHVRSRPGAHLVLPVPKDQSPPLDLLLAAAQIALLQAQLEPGEAAEVQYTRVRDVRSIPGEIGRVTVANEKVLRVARDPAALVGWAVDRGED